MNKKLYRSRKDKQLEGVCGGLGEYFETDTTLIRLLVAFLVISTAVFPGIILYYICAMIIPLEPKEE